MRQYLQSYFVTHIPGPNEDNNIKFEQGFDLNRPALQWYLTNSIPITPNSWLGPQGKNRWDGRLGHGLKDHILEWFKASYYDKAAGHIF